MASIFCSTFCPIHFHVSVLKWLLTGPRFFSFAAKLLNGIWLPAQIRHRDWQSSNRRSINRSDKILSTVCQYSANGNYWWCNEDYYAAATMRFARQHAWRWFFGNELAGLTETQETVCDSRGEMEEHYCNVEVSRANTLVRQLFTLFLGKLYNYLIAKSILEQLKTSI